MSWQPGMPQFNQGQGTYPPTPSPRRWRFRWGLWIVVPLACLAVSWFLSGVEPGFEWKDVMEWLNVRDQERYTKLTVLAVILLAFVGILRILVAGRDSEER